ncbi:hypothetical protein PPYR_05541 [Photinus pyralis]|uniref:acylglycerol lipase n=2 Tax=Photinus pyralis TaxID=7054 RepID=A0A1Y1N0A7_PHOPY|nr:protein ABHD8-like [Photinus pyralis]KAB0801187.1 hypothetical protein PPYR_05541 [Photinus pyralis]
MSREETVSQNSLCESVTKVINPCVYFLTNFTFAQSVHPVEPATPALSEYLLLPHHRRLRVIHVLPNEELHKSVVESKLRMSRSSLSEEYWFTRWNKPLKLGNCNCSFRRSQRFSVLPYETSNVSQRNLSQYFIPPTKIINLETFVERLIQETLFEAFQEYLMKATKRRTKCDKSTGGVSNLAFVQEDDGVILRRQIKKNCLHTKTALKKKPTVILLHGIGSSADVWWHIINTLVQKGYEVVAPDMLGHGFSSIPDQPEAYKFKNLLKYTLALFDQYIGCDESKSSIVIGHSFGCSLATALCRYRSHQIVQLILISGGGPTPLAPPPPADNTALTNCLRTVFHPLLFCGMKRTIFYSLRGKHFRVCDTESAVPNHILQYFADGQSWPEGDAAFHRRILIPTLLVHGLQDTLVTLVQECEMERTIPRAFLELIPNAGHMCMLETPQHLSHMIMCFIDWWSR